LPEEDDARQEDEDADDAECHAYRHDGPYSINSPSDSR
jgi:hypothetical protein